jgi:acyl-CoA synthetase (AMP-forming)/AMP-acid ligase II
VVGDAVARPLIDTYHAGGGASAYDTSGLLSIGSGAAPLSPATKAELQALFPTARIADGFGSSETGAQARNLGDGRFAPYDADNTVLDDTAFEPVVPGSGAVGRLARRGHIPLGYYNDPAKTAATFVERDGERWALTGDVATVLQDGTIRIFGRGSQCINTGGEKVYPEEVESALRTHPAVYDALVVGVADPRWGQQVTAVVQPRAGATLSLDDLVAHCRPALAAYKLPKALVLVDEVVRSPVGKPDYRWAAEVAAAGLTGRT